MSEESEVEKTFKQHEIIPDIILISPKEFLKITYKDGAVVDKGNELKPIEVKFQPKLQWTAEDDALYTLMMVDPDAPSRKQPTFRSYQHWLVVNIPGKALEKGNVRIAYVGAGPPQATGLHRYVFLIYKQNGNLKFTDEVVSKNSGKNRPRFNVGDFVKKYKLNELIAGNFFQSKWDESVPAIHKQLSGK